MHAIEARRADLFASKARAVDSVRRKGPETGLVTREDEAISFEAELEALHERSFGWALSCSRFDHELAADVLQTTYLKVLDGRARFGNRSSFSTWLFGVIRRTASEHRRRRATRNLLLLRHAREVERNSASEVPGLPVEMRQLRSALLVLPPRQREVLHLVFYEDYSIREAAEVMGVGIGSARVHYDRAKKRLRTLLSEQDGEEKNR